MNENLCQECQERECTIMLACDSITGKDLDWPVFLCSICDSIRMIRNGWVQLENGNWERESRGTLYLNEETE